MNKYGTGGGAGRGRGHPIEFIDLDGNTQTITETNKAFIDEYLANGYNATKAWNTVNQTDAKTAHASSKVFWKPEVQAYLKVERKRIYDQKCIDQMRIFDRLADIAFAEKGDRDYQTAHQLKALEMLAKFGGFVEEKKGDGYDNIRITLNT